jgi:cob(I)alamin adenosyltransferase
VKIYTKTGDKGTTSLLSGRRVSKADLRIDAYGTVDELNSHLGLLTDQPVNEPRRQELRGIQSLLFTIGSQLANDPEKPYTSLPILQEEDVIHLENLMDEMDKDLPEMRNFILPGGHPSVSICHVARTVCRRAERLSIALGQHQPVEEIIVRYLNRLSDLLFVLARKMAKELEVEEIPWKSRN